MTGTQAEIDGADVPQDWRIADEGWGRRAVDFATLNEPQNCREYVAVHHRLGVDAGDRLLDVACGAGLALELASARGATCAGVDASTRLAAVARDRNPDADVRVGDMQALPWEGSSFDVVTSFRGIWGTTPTALVEVHRVLVPGGRLGMTVWGNIKRSAGAWLMAPLALVSTTKIEDRGAMLSLGWPGVGEDLLRRCGFDSIERHDIPCFLEFPDPEAYARALASSGPAFEALQDVGESAFFDAARQVATDHVRGGLPLRAALHLVGFTARKP